MTDPRRSWQRLGALTRYSPVSVGATGGRQYAANVRMVRAVPGAAASEARHSLVDDSVRGGDDPPVVRSRRAKPADRSRAAEPSDSSAMHPGQDPRLARFSKTGSELALC